jgi:hypothetical protein
MAFAARYNAQGRKRVSTLHLIVHVLYMFYTLKKENTSPFTTHVPCGSATREFGDVSISGSPFLAGTLALAGEKFWMDDSPAGLKWKGFPDWKRRRFPIRHVMFCIFKARIRPTLKKKYRLDVSCAHTLSLWMCKGSFFFDWF